MLQRKQTLFFLFAAIAVIISIFAPFFSGYEKDLLGTLKPVVLAGKSNPILLIIGVLFTVFIICNIFLYNNRPVQFKINMLLIIVAILYTGLFVFQVGKFKTGKIHWGIYLHLPIVIFLMAAAYFINADEKMVKNADRLR